MNKYVMKIILFRFLYAMLVFYKFRIKFCIFSLLTLTSNFLYDILFFHHKRDNFAHNDIRIELARHNFPNSFTGNDL